MTFYKIKCVSAPNKAEGGMDLDIAEIGCASGPALVVDPCFGPPSLTGTLGKSNRKLGKCWGRNPFKLIAFGTTIYNTGRNARSESNTLDKRI